ncbi:unnamed protein product [Pleuronectes platessa]|uniref:Uncharacterized protein n=1 Tax=Pleuronectes platessa TaxID=8262 RepID=A0A9N7TKW0_PLEPL|nr:unnamed protein product [Pleuronectes platessa]
MSCVRVQAHTLTGSLTSRALGGTERLVQTPARLHARKLRRKMESSSLLTSGRCRVLTLSRTCPKERTTCRMLFVWRRETAETLPVVCSDPPPPDRTGTAGFNARSERNK